jgi:serine/threonine protein kinase
MLKDRMMNFLTLCHPHVMRLVGIIPPMRGIGPIILTPYHPRGSLEDVLTLIRQRNDHDYRNEATQLRMIVSLVSELNYLHNRSIVHRELKPSDLIVGDDGSLLITDYVTSFLEEHKYTRASQTRGPSYMAPEVYDDQQNGTILGDATSDVFSFGLILYELLTHQKVFPSSMSAALIMRRAMSTSVKERPPVPSDTNAIVRDLITLSWNAAPEKRPMMESLWKSMRGVGFHLFPTVAVTFTHLQS